MGASSIFANKRKRRTHILDSGRKNLVKFLGEILEYVKYMEYMTDRCLEEAEDPIGSMPTDPDDRRRVDGSSSSSCL